MTNTQWNYRGGTKNALLIVEDIIEPERLQVSSKIPKQDNR